MQFENGWAVEIKWLVVLKSFEISEIDPLIAGGQIYGPWNEN